MSWFFRNLLSRETESDYQQQRLAREARIWREARKVAWESGFAKAGAVFAMDAEHDRRWPSEAQHRHDDFYDLYRQSESVFGPELIATIRGMAEEYERVDLQRTIGTMADHWPQRAQALRAIIAVFSSDNRDVPALATPARAPAREPEAPK